VAAVPAALLPRLPHPRHALAAALALVACLAVALVAGGGGAGADGDVRTLAGPGFELDRPAGWSLAAPAELARTPDRPVAILRRPDRRGVVVVRARGPLAGPLPALASELGRELGARMPGMRPVGARVVRLATGDALSYTFVRGAVVQSVVVAPVGARTVTIESVARGGDAALARELGGIVRSLHAR
jgi:hypothetical protein